MALFTLSSKNCQIEERDRTAQDERHLARPVKVTCRCQVGGRPNSVQAAGAAATAGGREHISANRQLAALAVGRSEGHTAYEPHDDGSGGFACACVYRSSRTNNSHLAGRDTCNHSSITP